MLTTFFFTGDELGESDTDEIIENKRFPQQRFSPVNPVRARSVTPKRGRYFSPIPVSRPLTPDFRTHRRSLPQFSTDALGKYKSSSTLQQRDYSLVLAATKTKSPSVLQSGPKSAFTSIESKRTAMTGGNAEKDIRSLPISSNNESLSASIAQSLTPWSRSLTPVTTTFQSKLPQTHDPSDMSSTSTEYSNRIIPEVSSVDKSPLAETQCGRNIPRFVCTSDGMSVGSFTGQTLSYPQISSSPYVPPFVAFSYPGLHIQDKVMSSLGPRALPSQLPGSPAALLRPNVVSHPGNPFMNALLSSVFMQSPITSGHSLPQATFVQNFDADKSPVDNSKYQGTDTTAKSDEVSQGSGMLAGISTRKEREPGENVLKGSAKKILKKFVPDGMEQ